jgi:hypothetical protein
MTTSIIDGNPKDPAAKALYERVATRLNRTGRLASGEVLEGRTAKHTIRFASESERRNRRLTTGETRARLATIATDIRRDSSPQLTPAERKARLAEYEAFDNTGDGRGTVSARLARMERLAYGRN